MPIPQPRDEESRDEYVTRCMSNEVMKSEFPKTKQRVAVCMQIYKDKSRRKRKGRSTKSEVEDNDRLDETN